MFEKISSKFHAWAKGWLVIVLVLLDMFFMGFIMPLIGGLMKSGELEKLYARWFLSPIPPKNVNLNFPMSEQLKKLIKTPGDAPAESFNRR